MALTQTQRRSLAGMAGMAFLATVGLFAAIDNHASGVGKALIVAIAVTGLVFHSAVRHQLMIGKALSAKRLRLLSAFFLVGAVLVAVSLSGGADGLLYFGLVCLYVGIGLIVAELRRSGKVGKWVGAGFFVVSVALLVVGANTLPNSPGTGGTLLAAGVSALFIAMSLFSASANRVPANASLRFAGVLAVLATALYVGALALVHRSLEIDKVYVVFLGLVVLASLIGTASCSNGDVVIVIAACGGFDRGERSHGARPRSETRGLPGHRCAG